MYELREYQKKAVAESLTCIEAAKASHAKNLERTAIVLSAPTGAGKTVMSGAVIDHLLAGDGQDEGHAILWVTDNPSLNRQSANRIRVSTSGEFDVKVLSGNGEDPQTGRLFDQKAFTRNTLYLLNTQAASANAGLSVTRRDGVPTGRVFTIHDTIRNTVEKLGARFIVMIDEAHRGTEREEDDDTIIGGIIKNVPVVYGISATERRFEDWMRRENRHLKKVSIPITEVRNAGIIKANLIVSDTIDGKNAHMTLLKEAVRQTIAFEKGWQRYCDAEGIDRVYPLLVVQVEDSGTDPEIRTLFEYELDLMIKGVMEEWPQLDDSAFVHTFGERKPLEIEGLSGGKRIVQYMLPDEISENNKVRVVFAKTAISTGWDCPRAEVLVSFRRASDESYITQLIGRMIRQPLGRRVEQDESLNATFCTLPNFDQKAVQRITKRLRDEEGIALDVVNIAPVTYERVKTLPEAAYDALLAVPSYQVPAGAFASKVSLLRHFAAALARDGLNSGAQDVVKLELCRLLDSVSETRARRFRKAVDWAEQLERELLQNEAAGVVTITRTAIAMEDNGDAVDQGELLLQKDASDAAWMLLADSVLTPDVQAIYQTHLISAGAFEMADANRRLKAFDHPGLEIVPFLEEAADNLIQTWAVEYGTAMDELMFEVEEKYAVYREVTGKSNDPILKYLPVAPQVIQENIAPELIALGSRVVGDENPNLVRKWVFEQDNYWHGQHLYTSVEGGGRYLTHLGGLGSRVLRNELNQFPCVGWYNNPLRGQRSITVPWINAEEQWGEMHPDFVFFREGDGAIRTGLVDVLTGPNKDVLQKLRWWLWFADQHHSSLDSLRLVMQERDKGTDVMYLDLTEGEDLREALRRELARENPVIEMFFKENGGIYAAAAKPVTASH